jgi:predicted dehydrogenase
VVAEPAGLLSNPDIDLIVIATPNDTHFPLAKAALEAGKHVVVDKPFTVTLSQARAGGRGQTLRQTAVRFS